MRRSFAVVAMGLMLLGLPGCGRTPGTDPDSLPSAAGSVSDLPEQGHTAAIVSHAAAPAELPGEPESRWHLPDNATLLTLLGNALVIRQDSGTGLHIRGLRSNGEVAWEHAFTFGPDPVLQRLEWAVGSTGRRLALRVPPGPVLILDETGRSVSRIEPGEPLAGELLFAGSDRYLLLGLHHGRSRMEPVTYYLYDLAAPAPRPAGTAPACWHAAWTGWPTSVTRPWPGGRTIRIAMWWRR